MNEIRGIRTVEVNGKPIKLQFSTNALVVLEERLELKLQEFGEKFADGAGIKDLREIMFAAMIEHQPETKIQDAGRLIDSIGLENVQDVIMDVMTMAMPKAGGDLKNSAAAAGDGESS